MASSAALKQSMFPPEPLPRPRLSGSSGTPVRACIVRALEQQYKADSELGEALDRLAETIVTVSESGAPPPPRVTEPKEGTKRK